jgi:phage baseplate assembly protein W
MSLEGLDYPNRIDTTELSRIKNQFLLRDRANIEGLDRKAPTLYFDRLSTPSSLNSNTLSGIYYPIELDGDGGIKIAHGYDRIGQAIKEVFETRIGERIGQPFFGVRELLFETISEDTEAQSIKRQLLSAIPYLSTDMLSVSLSLTEDGTCFINATYSVEGGENVLVSYSFR